MEPFVLSPQSAAKLFMLNDEDILRARQYTVAPQQIFQKLRKEIECIATHRDALTQDECMSLPPIIDLSGSEFPWRLSKADLSYCLINDSNFSRCITMDVRFIGSSLRQANFSGGDVHNVRFDNADLTNAKFKRAQLCDVRFKGADLTGSDFTGAIFYRSASNILEGAKNLDKAIGLPYLPPEVLAGSWQATFGVAGQQPAARGAALT